MDHETVTEIFKFKDCGDLKDNLISTICPIGQRGVLFGSFPSGLHFSDLRQRSLVQSFELPRLPTSVQATPLCIRPHPARDDSYFVCGRFPAILSFDLRMGLEKFISIYSGADSLSCITPISSDYIVVGGAYRGNICEIDVI